MPVSLIERMLEQTPDFRIRYRFLSAEEGGRKTGPPWQGYRCDWCYDGDDPVNDGVYMIWPMFEDSAGRPVPDGIPVSVAGTARM